MGDNIEARADSEDQHHDDDRANMNAGGAARAETPDQSAPDQKSKDKKRIPPKKDNNKQKTRAGQDQNASAPPKRFARLQSNK